MATDRRLRWPDRLLGAFRTQWRELGGFGRVMLIGLVLSLAFAVVLGFLIPARVEDHLIRARIDALEGMTQELIDMGLLPLDGQAEAQFADFDETVRHRLLGGESVRVKLWAPDDTVIYSDAPELIGTRFAMSEERLAAFAGETSTGVPQLDRPENEHEQGLGMLREFYVPVTLSDGSVTAVFEIYEDVAEIEATVQSTKRTVWLSIAIGLVVYLGFMVSITVANARIITKRALEAEGLAANLSRAREDERKHIVGALHDDIGQPLYRVLYGVQGARALADDEKLIAELARLEELLRTVDGTLRSELRSLHDETLQQIDLDTLLTKLVERAREETNMTLALRLKKHGRLPGMMRSALYRSAREAITNAWKHAGATRVSLVVRNGDGRVVLEVRDNGSGIDAPEGLGLTTTRQRLETVGGGMDVHREETGTVFRAWVPTVLQQEEE
jgi:signal transduction histidine kinase